MAPSPATTTPIRPPAPSATPPGLPSRAITLNKHLLVELEHLESRLRPIAAARGKEGLLHMALAIIQSILEEKSKGVQHTIYYPFHGSPSSPARSAIKGHILHRLSAPAREGRRASLCSSKGAREREEQQVF